MFLMYTIIYQPFENGTNNILLFINEYIVYMCAVMGTLFTDYIYDPDARDTLGIFLIYTMFLFLLVDLGTISITYLFALKNRLEFIFERANRDQERKELIKAGKIVVRKVANLDTRTEAEKAKEKIMKQLEAKKRKQKKEMKKMMAEKLARLQQKDESYDSEVRTPHYSSSLEEIR